MLICIGCGFRLCIWTKMYDFHGNLCEVGVHVHIQQTMAKVNNWKFCFRQHGFGWNSRGQDIGGGGWLFECIKRQLGALLPTFFDMPTVPKWLLDRGVFRQNSLKPSGSTVIRHFSKTAVNQTGCLPKEPDHQLNETKIMQEGCIVPKVSLLLCAGFEQHFQHGRWAH